MAARRRCFRSGVRQAGRLRRCVARRRGVRRSSLAGRGHGRRRLGGDTRRRCGRGSGGASWRRLRGLGRRVRSRRDIGPGGRGVQNRTGRSCGWHRGTGRSSSRIAGCRCGDAGRRGGGRCRAGHRCEPGRDTRVRGAAGRRAVLDGVRRRRSGRGREGCCDRFDGRDLRRSRRCVAAVRGASLGCGHAVPHRQRTCDGGRRQGARVRRRRCGRACGIGRGGVLRGAGCRVGRRKRGPACAWGSRCRIGVVGRGGAIRVRHGTRGGGRLCGSPDRVRAGGGRDAGGLTGLRRWRAGRGGRAERRAEAVAGRTAADGVQAGIGPGQGGRLGDGVGWHLWCPGVRPARQQVPGHVRCPQRRCASRAGHAGRARQILPGGRIAPGSKGLAGCATPCAAPHPGHAAKAKAGTDSALAGPDPTRRVPCRCSAHSTPR